MSYMKTGVIEGEDFSVGISMKSSAKGWTGYEKEKPSLGPMYERGTQLYPIPSKGDYVIFRERLYYSYIHQGKNPTGEDILYEPMQRYMTEDGRDIVFEIKEVHIERGLRRGYIMIQPVFPNEEWLRYYTHSCVQVSDLAYGLMICEKVAFNENKDGYVVIDDGRKMLVDDKR